MDRGPRVQAFPPRHKGDRATPSIVFAPDGLAPSLGSPAACVDLSLDSNVKDCLNDLRRRFMQPLSRRNVLTAAAACTVVTASIAANAQTFGNPDLPPQGAINTRDNPASVTDPGPQNPALASQFPDAFSPPPTDVGDMPMFWASFNNAPRRIQNGGWARQVTQADFQIAEEISPAHIEFIGFSGLYGDHPLPHPCQSQ